MLAQTLARYWGKEKTKHFPGVNKLENNDERRQTNHFNCSIYVQLCTYIGRDAGTSRGFFFFFTNH